MHIDDASRQYINGGGERHTTTCYLLRRSYRDENGKPRKETLANLSVCRRTRSPRCGWR